VLVFSAATAGPVTISGDQWSVTLSGLVNGANGFAVVATDEAGNTTFLPGTIVYRLADGKLDGSGPVGLADALKALRIAAGLATPTAADLVHGDVAPLVQGVPTQNGAIDLTDAQLILRKAAGLVDF
jgi:hypothetical protein